LDDVGLGTYTYSINKEFTIPTVVGDIGTHTVYIEFYDGCTKTKSGTVTVIVHDECYNNTAPELIVPTSTTLNPGDSYSTLATATDIDGILGTLTFSLVSIDPIPVNPLTVAADGTITWNPDCADIVDGADTTYTITVGVSDGCDTTADSFTIKLFAEKCLECYNNTAPELIVPTSTTLNPGDSYSTLATATDIDGILGTLTFSLVSIDPIPVNPLTVAADGTITWNPDCADIVKGADTTYEVTVGVSDGCDRTTGSFTITLTTEGCECILSTLTILTNHNTFFGDYYPNGYPISFKDFTENPSNTFIFNGEGINNALILLNKDNNLKFIPETENCYGVEMSYQWKNWGCNNEILEPIPPGIAQNGETCPTQEYVPSKHFTVCNPPSYNTLYIYLGGDTYIIHVARELK